MKKNGHTTGNKEGKRERERERTSDIKLLLLFVTQKMGLRIHHFCIVWNGYSATFNCYVQ